MLTKQKEIYLLSGLGADKRVFDFLDLSDYNVNHIDWISPQKKESIENYAQRLLDQIPSKRPTLIGLSFGGIMAVEVGKLIETENIILISSAKTMFDIPFLYRLIGILRINKIIPTKLLKNVNSSTYWFFGVKTLAEKQLLKGIIADTDSEFLKWALDKIVNWKNKTRLKNITQIHGTKDRILPLRAATSKVKNGGHFMIVNLADEINKLLRKTLI